MRKRAHQDVGAALVAALVRTNKGGTHKGRPYAARPFVYQR